MQVIGITGGAGAGKSAILEYLEENYKVKNLVADRIAKALMEPDTECYRKLLKFLPVEAYHEDESIDRAALAELIFQSEDLRSRVNRVVHPAVKEYILDQIAEQERKAVLDFVVVESAILIEDHYDQICDELWYVYATEEVRRRRLLRTRGYTRERVSMMFESQLSDRAYRKSCQVVIDNNGTREETFQQVAQIIRGKGKKGRGDQKIDEKPLVFGLDIGTRNVVGTVGYKERDDFYVIAQDIREHETRAMLDGQIHDIGRVGRTVNAVKTALEEQLDMTLEEVCIAAAGRVLKTVSTTVEYVLPEEAIVTEEEVHALDLVGIEKAQQILAEQNDTNLKFYCVGYSIVKYYLNGDAFSNLVGHKAEIISEDIIVTFLPEDVVEGLYSAVELAGLKVSNLTLEPIAAISVAIPETFRMLNIALVDVGAGTSDISITKGGSIIAYGMIPSAGDEITDFLVQHYLVDFKTAEHIKISSTTEEEIEYQDIMMIKHKISAQEVWELMKPLVDKLAGDVAAKIRELNGGSTVSASFVVGGGGKVHGFVEQLAAELELPQERVALRGEEVLQEIYFEQQDRKKDPLLVTPIGICLSFYEQKNNFIFVWLNGERIKLYDNSKLTLVDAALQAGFTNEQLFEGKGAELRFTVNGQERIVHGEPGEPATVQVDGEEAGFHEPLKANSEIIIELPEAEDPLSFCVEDLGEYGEHAVSFTVNGKEVSCPNRVEVNGVVQAPGYPIQENDKITLCNSYTVAQLADYLGETVGADARILVNNRPAAADTEMYDGDSVAWSKRRAALGQESREPDKEASRQGAAKRQENRGLGSLDFEEPEEEKPRKGLEGRGFGAKDRKERLEDTEPEGSRKWEEDGRNQRSFHGKEPTGTRREGSQKRDIKKSAPKEEAGSSLQVIVNNKSVTLTGKPSYIFVDVFDAIEFDLNAGKGRALVLRLNGKEPAYMAPLKYGDQIQIYWEG
ncbi:dephospho-CoA kinase [Lachnospiraceae bacterium 29-84]